MNRIIRFRAYNHLQKKMLYASDISDMPMDTSLVAQPSEDYGTTYLQWTGLRDVKGKEIYEGDIRVGNYNVMDKKYRSVELMTWDNYGASFYWKPVLNGEIPDFISVVVVGNVFENPELIKP